MPVHLNDFMTLYSIIQENKIALFFATAIVIFFKHTIFRLFPSFKTSNKNLFLYISQMEIMWMKTSLWAEKSEFVIQQKGRIIYLTVKIVNALKNMVNLIWINLLSGK